MSEVARLYVSIGAKMDDFKRGMSDVQKKTEGMAKRFEDTGKRIQGVGTGMSKYVTAPIVAAGAGVMGLVSKYATAGDEIAKTSTKLGVSTDALQEMDYWAGQNGISAGAMERAVGRLNQRIGRAAEGNEKYAEAFEAVGVSLQDSEGNVRDTEDVMKDTIASLREVEDPALRSARASEIFGTKMARDLMPALEDGSLSLEEAAEKAHELGIVMDEDAVRAAEDYEDAMDDLKRSFGGVFQEIATKLIPVLVDDVLPVIQDRVIPAIRRFGERIGSLISWFMDLSPTWQRVIGIAIAFFAAIGPILMVVGKFITIIGPLIAIIGKAGAVIMAIVTGPFAAIVAAIAGAIAIGVLLVKNWDKVKGAASDLLSNIKDVFGEIPKIIKRVVGNAVSWGRDLISNLASGVRDAASQRLSGAVDSARGLLNRLNPFARSSPSLVDRVQDGVRAIEGAYKGLEMPRFDLPGVDVSSDQSVNHTGTIRIEGVNDEGQFVAATDVALDKLSRAIADGDRRIPSRTKLIPT